MFSFVRKRLFTLVIVLFGVTILSFVLSNLSPIDPAEAYASRLLNSPTEEQIATIRRELGTDLPIYQQYFKWIGRCLQGDFGVSYFSKKPIIEDIAVRLPQTLKLVGLTLLWILIFSIPTSITAALNKDSAFDHVVRIVTIFGVSIPRFWLGFVFLLLFAIVLPIFRVVEYGSAKSLILPSLVLAIPTSCSYIRMIRATILSNLNKAYVTYAKARGISNSRIIWMHVLRNSLPPMITMFCQYLGMLMAGSAIVENVFSLRGMGSYMLDAMSARDLPAINACVLIIAFVFVLCNALSDGVNMLVNPRISQKEGS